MKKSLLAFMVLTASWCAQAPATTKKSCADFLLEVQTTKLNDPFRELLLWRSKFEMAGTKVQFRVLTGANRAAGLVELLTQHEGILESRLYYDGSISVTVLSQFLAQTLAWTSQRHDVVRIDYGKAWTEVTQNSQTILLDRRHSESFESVQRLYDSEVEVLLTIPEGIVELRAVNEDLVREAFARALMQDPLVKGRPPRVIWVYFLEAQLQNSDHLSAATMRVTASASHDARGPRSSFDIHFERDPFTEKMWLKDVDNFRD